MTATAAVLSLHSSPLSRPGTGDSGGMNVYVRELVAALAQAGVESTVYVRRNETDLPEVVEVERGFRVVHIDAGPPELSKEEVGSVLDDIYSAILARIGREDPIPTVVHANYWLSATVAHRLKHELDVPMVNTFHTLARVKAAHGDPEPEARGRAEQEAIGCSELILASSTAEASDISEHYETDQDRIEIVTPGVDHAFFSPGSREGARDALGISQDVQLVLFVGRVQPLKGLDTVVEALSILAPTTHLMVVGGPSGALGEATLRGLQREAQLLGVAGRVHWVPPQPHHKLSSYYRAADVCVVPSRSESFGFVALEAAACGVPVVASAVGGLTSLVDDGRTGLLVDRRTPESFAAAIAAIMDSPVAAARMGEAGAEKARSYTWSTAAGRLRRLYADIAAGELVHC